MTKRFRITYAKDEPQSDGTIKTYWPDIGMAFEKEDGSLILRLNSLPLPHVWNGSLHLYPNNAPRGKAQKGQRKEKGEYREYKSIRDYDGPEEEF